MVRRVPRMSAGATHAHREPRPRGGALPRSGMTMERLYGGADMVTFRELLRVSHDDSGVERSNDEQHADHVDALARQPRWRLSDLPAYSEVGSASIYRAGAPRADFPALLAAIASGTFGADVLLMWEASRGSREVGEWLALIELCASRGVLIAAYSKGMRFYDCSEPEDRAALLRDAIDAELEAAKTSKRVRRAMRKNAEAGKQNGGRRAYGFKPGGREVVEDEADVIRWAAERILAGDSPRHVAALLNERGIPAAEGGEWHPGALTNVLRSKRIAGIRTHHGEVMRPQPGKPWVGSPAIISEATHVRLVATLASRSRAGDRGRVAWELTGLLVCGGIKPNGEVCGEPLVSNTDSKSVGATRRYQCRPRAGHPACGTVRIKAEPLEELLGRIVVKRLGDVQARRAAVPEESDAEERSELEAIAAARVATADQYAIDLDAQSKNETMAALRRREEVVEARLAAKVRDTSPLAFIIEDGLEGVTWEDTPVAKRRMVYRALIDHVVVLPATVPGSKRFEASRVTGGIVWRA
jgi:site-specific DNA recombinase